jgi:hypothetical protein
LIALDAALFVVVDRPHAWLERPLMALMPRAETLL